MKKYDFAVVVLITILVAAPVGYFAGSSSVSLSESNKDSSVTTTQAADPQQSPQQPAEGSEIVNSNVLEPERIDVSIEAARELLGADHPLLQEYQEVHAELEGLYRQYREVSDPADMPAGDFERMRTLDEEMLSLIRRIF